ncbi:unnamed protein product [Auanema sp. JU1783]|nr:unnamed protein product [Auanema sp. JU1783]
MRVLLAFSIFSLTLAADKAINLPCNRELDGLLAVDPDGNPTAFLSCQGVGVGNIGFWERKMCPNDMVFDFINQRCKAAPRKVHRKPQTNLNIAILNSSCAKGETCIGGTVCDADRMRCLCPYGTIPQLETLSCIKNENAFSPDRFKFSFENTNTGTGFLPNPNQQIIPPSNNGQASFMPNPNFNKFSSNSNSFASSSNSNFGNAPWTNNGQSASSSPNTFVDMMPNHKFVFGNFGTTQAPTTKAVPRLAEPGQSCRSNELCIGGSLCTFPIGLCLCPGDLEARDGECVLPASSSIKIQKVGIGAICNDLAECDDGSVCQMGRCACVSPLVQFEGKCVLRQERKEVGPGDLCDNGEICIKGSVCDKIIPVCVCPTETDLFDGECVRVFNSKPSGYLPTTHTPTIAPQASYVPPSTTQRPVPVQTPSTKTIPPVYTFNQNIVQQPTTYSYKAVTNQQVTSKPNHMKIALGGSKQAGVGVRCSLNTDCMIGAYCNGNTSPPSCQCLSTHVNVEGRCEKVIYPGQIGCRSSLQCTAAYAGTSCVDRVCRCPEGTKTVDQTCIPEPDECFPTCQHPLICSHSTCICPDGTNCSTELITFGHLVLSDDDNLHKIPNIIQTIKIRQRRQTSKMECLPGSESCSDGHGICIKEKCHCLNGLVARDGYCRPLMLPVNSSCDSENLSAVCEDGAICVDGFCHCQYPGGCDNSNVVMCENHSQCPQTFVCVVGRCVCNRNYELKNGQCQLREPIANSVYKSINSSCNERIDRCSGGSICLNGACQCVNGATENSGRCHQVPQGRCVHGELCINGSICELGRCKCQDGLTISARNPTVCVVISSEPGKSCHFGERCINGSVCRFGTCMCESKRVNVHGRCVKKDSLPGKSKKQKAGSMSTSIPPSNESSTSALTTESSNEPIPASEPGTIRNPGEKCSLLDICNGGSLCQDHMCKCQEHDIIIDNQCVGSQAEAVKLTKEKSISAPGQACDIRTTCTGGSVCIENLCRCETGLVNSQGDCQTVSDSDVSTSTSESPNAFVLHYPTGQKAKKESKEDRYPGMECVLTMQCPFRTECQQGVCRCKQGETIVDGTCRQSIHQVRVGGACNPQKGYDCVGESFCISGACICQYGMRPLDGLCVPVSQLNQVLPTKKCGPDSFCLGGSRCIENVCRCEKDYVPDVNDKCVKKSSVYPILKVTTPKPTTTTTMMTTTGLPNIGEPCSYYCADGLCRDGVCVDVVTEMEKVEMELKQNPAKSAVADEVMNSKSSTDELMIVGTHCYRDTDCPQASRCLQEICYCNAGYRATAGYCESIVPLGSPCVSTNQCPIHSVCVQGTCQCAASLRDGKACKPPRLGRPGDSCLDGVICSYNSYCGLMSSVCECPSGMSTQQGECRQTAAATGQSCVTSRNCHRFSYCDNGFCLCKSGFELVNDFCMPPAKRLSLNEVEELMHNGLEKERNDGPQAPMQERIRTETFLRSMMNNQENFLSPMDPPTPPMIAQRGRSSLPVLPPMTAMNPSALPTMTLSTGSPIAPTMRFNGINSAVNPAMSGFGSMPSSSIAAANISPQPNFLNPNSRFNSPSSVINSASRNTISQPEIPQVSTGPLPIDLTKPPFNYAMPPNYQVIYPSGSPSSFQNPLIQNDFSTSAALGDYFRNRFASFPIVSGASTVSGDSRTFDLNVNTTNTGGSTLPQKLRFAMPGEYCGDKVICLGNSFCTNDFCRCPEHCSAQNGICAYKIQAAVQPHKDALQLSGYDEDDEDRRYLNSSEERQFAQPLENCQNFEFCVGGSECLPIAAKLGLMCQCPVGTIFFQDECIEAPKGIGLIGIGDSCGKNEICLGGSVCTEEKCICRGGRKDVLGICVFTGHPGDDCSQGQLCVDGSVCAGQKRTCICPPGKRSLLGKCVKQDSPEDGFASNPSTNEEDTQEKRTDRRKFSSVYPGENCNGSLSICMDNSRCSQNHICECLPRFFNVDGRCVPIDMVRKPSESCTVTTICVTGARCIEDVCTCADGLIGLDDRCIPVSNNIRRHPSRNSIGPGPTCEHDEDCPLHFICNEKLCICHGSSSECLSMSLLSVDAQCFEDINCPLNSKCNEGICICVDGYRMETDRCVERRRLGTSASPLLQNLPMFASTSPGFSTTTVASSTKPFSAENLVLNRIASVSVPALPPDPAMASRLLSSFLNVLSQASDSMRFSDSFPPTASPKTDLESNDITNTISSIPGQPCGLPNLICSDNSICFNDYCICSYDYLPINDKCEPRDGKVTFGLACSETHRCSEKFICLNDVCSCPPNDSTCNPNEPVTSPPGGSCTDARECTGGSVCREGWCICPDPSMIVQKGICIQSGLRPTVPPKTVPVYTTSQPTAPVYQTQPSSAAPTSRPPPPVNTFNALPTSTHQGRKVPPGSQCGPLDSCVGGSMCIDSQCVCPPGTQGSQNGRCELATTTVPTTRATTASTWRTTRRPVDFIELPTHAPNIVDYNNQRINNNIPEYTSLSSGYNGHNIERNYGRPSIVSSASPSTPYFTTKSTTTTTTTTSTTSTTPTRPTTLAQIFGNKNECEAIGLYCRGNTICINKSCQCPDGHILHNDGCVPPSEAGKRKVRGKARHQATTVGIVLSKPGEDCADGQTCTGGSVCNDEWDCACPADKPVLAHGVCVAKTETPKRQAVPGESCDENTECINSSSCHSGQCRCAPQFIALSGFCVQMPMSTTPQMKTFSKPLESCENGETCEGGSKCDDDTLMCMCPKGQVAFGPECKVPPGATVSQVTTQEAVSNPSTTECENDNNCGDGKLCVAGRCRCRPGTVDNAGVCELLEEIEIGERPIPISYARHRVLTEKQKPASSHAEHESSYQQSPDEDRQSSSSRVDPVEAITRAPSRAEGQKPRVVGPPIRRPKPKPKTSSSGSSSGGTGSGTASYKTGGSGNGNCPPGNEATRDSSGKLIICNGLEPNCPPRSYCYITSGGFATEEYNCCKSW